MIKAKKQAWNKRHVELLIMASLGVIFLFVFAYLPMSGIILAFRDGDYDVDIIRATFGAEWTLENFKGLFADQKFWSTFKNTLSINLLLLVFNFPMPIIFALFLNEINSKKSKTIFQSCVNFPHFISWVVYGGIIKALTDMNTGIINPILDLFGLSSAENPIDLNLADYFYPKMIIASIIKGTGWGSIVYTAAIAGIDTEVYEAAVVDGASRWDKMFKITLPLMMPTITIFLLLNISKILGNSFEQFYVFQSTENLSRTRVLATYSYTIGFTYGRFSTSTAISLFQGIIAVMLLLSSNFLSKKMTGNGIF